MRNFIAGIIFVTGCAGLPREEVAAALTDIDAALVVAADDYAAPSTSLAKNPPESDKMKRRRVAMVEAARKVIATMKGKL